MKYFRVELDEHGMLLHCDEVSRAHYEAPDKHIFFVSEQTASEAVGVAYRRYVERVEQRRQLKVDRVGAGKCRDCGDPTDSGTRCLRCAESNRASCQRSRLKRKGLIETLTRTEGAVRRRALARLALLQEVLAKYRGLFADDFERWLLDEIGELSENTLTPEERHRRDCRN